MSGRCLGLLCVFVVIAGPAQAAEKLETRSLGERTDVHTLPLTLPTASPASSSAVTAGNRSGRLFVLAIGINAYPAQERLNYAVKDAQDVTQVLRAKGRKVYSAVESKLLTNREADHQGILAASPGCSAR
jgi:hypothetical protein